MATQTRYPQSNAPESITYIWNNPENAYASDNVVTTGTIPDSKQYQSIAQRYYNFGFDIPGASTINSVTMQCRVSKTGGQANDFMSMLLFKNTSAKGNSFQFSPNEALSDHSRGENTGTWSVAELNANSLEEGPSLQIVGSKQSWYNDSVFNCDYVRITVDYTDLAVDVTFGVAEASAEAPAAYGTQIIVADAGVALAVAEAPAMTSSTIATAFPSKEWGLRFWEEVAGLPYGSGNSITRRQKIMSVLSGWSPLTTSRFAKSLSRKLGGLQVQVKEYTAANTITIYIGGAYNPTELDKALTKLKPAHLAIVVSASALTAPDYSTS